MIKVLTPAEEIAGVVAKLSNPSNAIAPAAFSSITEVLDQPGLYAWWVDAEGLMMLSVVLEHDLPSLIYAGQAGASSSRSGKRCSSTLRSRIRTNHLRGNVLSSTFRRTLTAVLRQPLTLSLGGSRRLDAASNKRLSDWMSDHLKVTVVPYPNREALATIEQGVLQILDPPLNLEGRPATTIRQRIKELRSQLLTHSP